jgi:diguanylate cyclase (GGDEF)-like protein
MWKAAAEQLAEELRTQIMSYAEYEVKFTNVMAIESSPIRGFHVTIEQPTPFATITLGKALPDEPDIIETNQLDEHMRYLARCQIWFRTGGTREDRRDATDQFIKLLNLWWRGDERDEKGKILSGAYPALQRALERFVAELLPSGVAVIFADLDHFKAFNDHEGEQKGDVLIAKCASALQRYAPSTAIVIHRSGDEFLLVLPAEDVGAALVDTIELRRIVNDMITKDEYQDKAAPLGISFGLAILDGNEALSWQEMEGQADRALKPSGIKRRGKVSMAIPENAAIPDITALATGNARALAIASAIFLSSKSAPFANIWLNALSEYTTRCIRNAATIGDFLQLLSAGMLEIDLNVDPCATEAMYIADGGQWRYSQSVSISDMHLAVAHGLALSTLRGESSLMDRWELRVCTQCSTALLEPLEAIIPTRIECIHEIERFMLPTRDATSDSVDPRRVILLTVGPQEKSLSLSLFADVVYVDDRPTLGGGLPDMWEAALSQTIMSVESRPNVRHLVALGVRSNGLKTIQWLEQAESWVKPEIMDQLSSRLGLSTIPIRNASRRLRRKRHSRQFIRGSNRRPI